MSQSIHLSIASMIFAALLPVTAWGYGPAGYPCDSIYPSYTGDAESHQYRGSFRVQTGMTGDGYYARVRLDGLRPEDIHVSLQRNRLVIQAAQGGRYGPPDAGTHGTSQWHMSFRRQLRLPDDADWTRMTTNIQNGIMEIYMPRRR